MGKDKSKNKSKDKSKDKSKSKNKEKSMKKKLDPTKTAVKITRAKMDGATEAYTSKVTMELMLANTNDFSMSMSMAMTTTAFVVPPGGASTTEDGRVPTATVTYPNMMINQNTTTTN